MALREGEILGGYRIVRLLGRGGMGTVYLADDVRLGRKVAIKVLSLETAESPHVRERFVRESRTAASLDHPNILPIYEAGEADGQPFIAMRYVPGPDLEGIIQRDGALPLERVLGLIDQVASALDAAHGAGLIHRDVKPGNILVAAGSQPGTDHAYLSDFGLTKHADYSGSQLTRSGQLMGSVGYVAPEQIEGKPIDARVDVYSLGCVLFECLAGAQPYPRDSEIATLYAHAQAPPPSLALARPELPPTIDAVIAKAMAKSPEERYQTAGALARALTEAAQPEATARHLTRGFLFSDLRGYTAFVEAHGDTAAAQLLDTYRRLVRDVVRRYGGAEIKTEGDSFYVVFPSASDAVRCGLAIVTAAQAATATGGAPIQVGIGVHAGETAETEEGYVGSAVNIAARVCAQAGAGEVLVTDTVRGLTRTSGQVSFTPRGRKHLKGIAEPISVFAASVVAEGATIPSKSPTPVAGLARLPDGRRLPLLIAGGGGLVAILLAGLALTGGLGRTGVASPAPSAVGAGPGATVAGSPSQPATRVAWYQQFVDDLQGGPACVPNIYGQVESHVWLVDPDGASPVRLMPESDVWEVSPAWSPDGSRLVFAASEQATGGLTIWTVEADGSGARRLATDGADYDYFEAHYARPSWSADGGRIAFLGATTSTEAGVLTGSNSVATVKAEGSGKAFVRAEAGETKETPAPGAPARQLFDAPSWTPSGEVGFVARDALPVDSPGHVGLAQPDGSGYRELPLSMEDVHDVAWSPDGTRIALSAMNFDATLSVWVAGADGGGLQKLTTGPHDLHPSWSPDGRQIAFASDRDGHFEIYRMDRDGTNVVRLTTTPATVANCDPAWGAPSGPTPSPTATPAPGASAPPLAFHRGRLEPGIYRAGTFQPAMAFTLGPGWEGRRTYVDGLAVGRTGMFTSELDVVKLQVVIENGCIGPDMKTRVVASPGDVIKWLETNKRLKTTSVNPINVGGYSGIGADIVVLKGAACQFGSPTRVSLFRSGEDSIWLRQGEEAHVLSLDVRGSLVVFLAGGPSADGFVELALPVLASLQFPPP